MNEKEYKRDIIRPLAIEGESFRIIEEESRALGYEIKDPYQKALVFRTIHASADFDYLKTLVFSKDVFQHVFSCLLKKPLIFTDTSMVLAGVNKRKLKMLGAEINCYIADPDVAEEAKERGVTRSLISMEKAFKRHQKEPKRPVFFLVGNAPTALLALNDLVLEKGFRPDLIVGVPVGFVNVVEAKEMILNLPVPYVVNRGRKGGSNIAAAILNAFLYSLPGDDRRGY